MNQQQQQQQEEQEFSDEIWRKLLKPCPTEQQVLELLQTSYYNSNNDNNNSNNGATTEVTAAATTTIHIVRSLDSYDDCNYHVEINNEQYLLKIHNGVESRDCLTVLQRNDDSHDQDQSAAAATTSSSSSYYDFYRKEHMNSVIHYQIAISMILAKENINTGIPIPPINTNYNTTATTSSIPSPISIHALPVVSTQYSPCFLVCRLITYVPGITMCTMKPLPIEIIAQAGQYLGQIHQALDTITSIPNMIPPEQSSSLLALRQSECYGIYRASFKRTGIQPPAPLLLLDPSDEYYDTDDSSTNNNDPNKNNSIIPNKQKQPQKNENQHDNKNKNTSTNKIDIMDNSNKNDPYYFLDSSLYIPAKRYHQWDGKNTMDLVQFTKYIIDDSRRCLIEHILLTFKQDIINTKVFHQFRIGINHGDYNDANILIHNNDNPMMMMQVMGVIDFGDSTESWRVLDVSIAMAYAMLSTYGKGNRSISAAAAMLRGYNAISPLTQLERQHLVLFMACRLACSVTLGAYSMQRNPENTYLLLHSQPAWKALELLWSTDDQQRTMMTRAINRVFDQACLHSDVRGPIIECYDLVVPDPCVADMLYDVRMASLSLSSTSSSTTAEVMKRPVKRLKTTGDNGNTVITFVTGDANKLVEVQQILGISRHEKDLSSESSSSNLPFSLTSQKVDLPELQGDPFSIAQSKCLVAVEKVGGPVIIEDTSLCFNALNGMPGVYIKWFLESCGLDGLNTMLAGFADKTAYAQTIVAFCPGPGREVALFYGRTTGTIVMPRGSHDFGWDPIFEPHEGANKTYAEMTKDEKNAISHRSRAFAKLRVYLAAFHKDIILPRNE